MRDAGTLAWVNETRAAAAEGRVPAETRFVSTYAATNFILRTADADVLLPISQIRSLQIKEMMYIEAARSAGLPVRRILFRHILPNVAPALLVIATVNASQQVLNEAALSFLGLGVQPPTPTWGNILADGKANIEIAWWLSVYPGMAILVTVLSYNLFGEGLRDALDPRLRQ